MATSTRRVRRHGASVQAVLRALLLAPLTTLPAFASQVAAPDQPSVLVQTMPVQQGSVPDVVVAYGTAMPALDGGITLSVPQEGRVAAVAVTPGERVQAGATLLSFGTSAATASAYAQAVSALALARVQRVHAGQLLQQQLATRDQVAQADKAVADAQATLDALRREGAGQALRTLAAPFDAVVATVPVAPGERVAPGAALMTLTRLDGLVVTTGLEPSDHARVRPGATVQLTPLAGGASLTGQVLRVDAVLNPRTRLVDADLSVPVGSVMSGEAFRAAITVGRIQGWLVPHDAVLTDARGSYLFQVAAGHAVRVAVEPAGSGDGRDVVRGSLDPARPLVVEGSYQLTDGMAVREGGG